MTNSDRRTRRDILKTSGIALATATGAGCLNDASGTGSSGDEETGASTRTATDTATSTSTPTPEVGKINEDEFDWIPSAQRMQDNNVLRTDALWGGKEEYANIFGQIPIQIYRIGDMIDHLGEDSDVVQTLESFTSDETAGWQFVDGTFTDVDTKVSVGLDEFGAINYRLSNDEITEGMYSVLDKPGELPGEWETVARGELYDEPRDETAEVITGVKAGLEDDGAVQGWVRDRPKTGKASTAPMTREGQFESAYKIIENTIDDDDDSAVETNGQLSQMLNHLDNITDEDTHQIYLTQTNPKEYATDTVNGGKDVARFRLMNWLNEEQREEVQAEHSPENKTHYKHISGELMITEEGEMDHKVHGVDFYPVDYIDRANSGPGYMSTNSARP